LGREVLGAREFFREVERGIIYKVERPREQGCGGREIATGVQERFSRTEDAALNWRVREQGVGDIAQIIYGLPRLGDGGLRLLKRRSAVKRAERGRVGVLGLRLYCFKSAPGIKSLKRQNNGERSAGK